MSWDEIDADKKEDILTALKSIEDIALPVEEFILRLKAGGYKYLDFVSAYKIWLAKEKEKPQQNFNNLNSNREKITLNNLPKQEEYIVDGEW